MREMQIELEKLNKNVSPNILSEIISFICKLEKLSSKKEVITHLVTTLHSLLQARFTSFVERDSSSLKIICQIGENDSNEKVQNIFNKEMCEQLFDWVIKHKQIASLKLAEKEQFIFIPIVDYDASKEIEHGMLVFHMGDSKFELNKELNKTVNIISKLTSLSMTKFLKSDNAKNYTWLQDQIKNELKLTANLLKSISGSESNRKISFKVLESERDLFNGNIWWVSDLGLDITLVLIAHVESAIGTPSALLSGYILGEMNSLKTRAEISLKPQEVLKYLNYQLNPLFKSTGVTVNAWYGIFNIGARKVIYANANHPDPFLIGPEQQVSNLIIQSGIKGKPLGVDLNSIYTETTSNISGGSKLIICTQDLIEQASKIGDRYDPTWLPQVLETIGRLSLSEMRNSLESILSENKNGTAQKDSRLALLLEIPL